MVKLFPKNSNLCDHNLPTSQTDGQSTCDRNTALCTKVHRAVKKGDNAIAYHIAHMSTAANQIITVFIFAFLFVPLAGVINYVFTARCTLVQSAVLRLHVVCSSVRPSVCPSVTLVNCDHIGWNSSKIISPIVSMGRSLFLTLT